MLKVHCWQHEVVHIWTMIFFKRASVLPPNSKPIQFSNPLCVRVFRHQIRSLFDSLILFHTAFIMHFFSRQWLICNPTIILLNLCGKSGQKTTSSSLCWMKLLGNMMSSLEDADKSQNWLLLEPTKITKVNNKAIARINFFFPLILESYLFFIFLRGAYIWILKETHVWWGEAYTWTITQVYAYNSIDVGYRSSDEDVSVEDKDESLPVNEGNNAFAEMIQLIEANADEVCSPSGRLDKRGIKQVITQWLR